MHPDLTLPDGLHPNAAGVKVIVAGILPKVRELIAPHLLLIRPATFPREAPCDAIVSVVPISPSPPSVSAP